MHTFLIKGEYFFNPDFKNTLLMRLMYLNLILICDAEVPTFNRFDHTDAPQYQSFLPSERCTRNIERIYKE